MAGKLHREGAVFGITLQYEHPVGTGRTLDQLFPCDTADPKLAYQVWARALGAPGGSAVITTCATDAETGPEEVCSTENVSSGSEAKEVDLYQTSRRSSPRSLDACRIPLPTDVICGRFALFRDEFVDWFWQYANSGLRLAQIRFYPI